MFTCTATQFGEGELTHAHTASSRPSSNVPTPHHQWGNLPTSVTLTPLKQGKEGCLKCQTLAMLLPARCLPPGAAQVLVGMLCPIRSPRCPSCCPRARPRCATEIGSKNCWRPPGRRGRGPSRRGRSRVTRHCSARPPRQGHSKGVVAQHSMGLRPTVSVPRVLPCPPFVHCHSAVQGPTRSDVDPSHPSLQCAWF
jgi:hypothetical protein